MARWLKIAAGLTGGLGALALLAGGAGWWWVGHQVEVMFDQDWTAHEVDFPIPFPLTEAEVAELRAQKLAELAPAADGAAPEAAPVADAATPPPDPLEGVDLGAIALARAQERGKHLVSAIFVCTGCHGSDFGGGVMIDEAPIGKLLAPNITRGGKTANYKPRDWDRAVRHGILPNGKTSIMPVGDFKRLTDRDLSDIVAYLDTLPPKEGGEAVREFGPVGKVLVATGQLRADVEKVADHHAAHELLPPPPGVDPVFGGYVVSVCVGCHRDALNGGPMPFGPPDWPPATNLTPHADGLGTWTYDDFVRTVKRGQRKDGSPVRIPMVEILPYTANWTDTELQAAWAYLQQLPPTPTGT